MNNLPKSWCVLQCNDPRFYLVIKYLNERGANYLGSLQGAYYGIGLYGRPIVVTNEPERVKIFKILTLDEFIKLSKSEMEQKYELTAEKILQMANESEEVRKSLKKAFPEVFENDKYLTLNELTTCVPVIRVHSVSNLHHKSYFLSPMFNWEIIKDNKGSTCLVPTKKEY